jgi:hypothetical protein
MRLYRDFIVDSMAALVLTNTRISSQNISWSTVSTTAGAPVPIGVDGLV